MQSVGILSWNTFQFRIGDITFVCMHSKIRFLNKGVSLVMVSLLSFGSQFLIPVRPQRAGIEPLLLEIVLFKNMQKR